MPFPRTGERDLRLLTTRMLSLAKQEKPQSEFAQGILDLLQSFTGANGLEVLLFRGETLHHGALRLSPRRHFSYEVFPSREASPRAGSSEGHRSLTIPLRAGKELLGHLLLTFPTSQEVILQRFEGLLDQLAETVATVFTLHRMNIDLRERMKELTCLYGIAHLSEDQDVPLSQTLQSIVDLLPPAWQYPELVSARLSFDDRSFSTAGFRPGSFRMQTVIAVGGQIRGAVEVFYLEGRPDFGQDPFLPEEYQLIATIAREVALIIERRQGLEERGRLQGQLRHADRLATVGQLVAGVAHELNEPLANILGFSQLILRSPDLVPQTTRDLEKIVKASLTAREVIRKLLLFSRQVPAIMSEVEINRIVQEGMDFLENRCTKGGIDIVRDLAPNLPPVHADPTQLNQVLVNLIVNAIQAMPRGGRLLIRTALRRGMVLFSVTDTGIGMDDEVRSKLFTPFFTTKEVGEGTGLGLAVVHGIVTSHGGVIQVESKPGEGSRFDVLIPALEAADREEKAR